MRRYMWLCFCLLLCLIGGLLLDSYAKREITKTIVLEEKDGQSAENEYVVKNIKEYFYEGVQKEEGWIAVEQDSEYIYALKYIEDGYEYQKIDIGQEKILSSLVVETEPLEQVKIAPGGKYIAYERQYPFGVELVMYFVEDESQLTLGAGYGCSLHGVVMERDYFILLLMRVEQIMTRIQHGFYLVLIRHILGMMRQ